jgi:glutathione S-transferase
MNPHGRAPIIADDGAVLWGSHLAARCGHGTFWGFCCTRKPQRDMPPAAGKIARGGWHFALLDDCRSLGDEALSLAEYRYVGLDNTRLAIPYVETFYRRLTDRQHVMVLFETLRGRLDS